MSDTLEMWKARAEKAEETLRTITPTLLDGRGCWTHDEIVAAVNAIRRELEGLRYASRVAQWRKREDHS